MHCAVVCLEPRSDVGQCGVIQNVYRVKICPSLKHCISVQTIKEESKGGESQIAYV